MSRRKGAKQRQGGAASKRSEPASSTERRKRPVLRFVLWFIVCMAVFYAVTLTSAFQQGPFQRYLEVNATVSAWLLDVLGADARSVRTSVITDDYSLSIARGCDAIEPAALFAAAVLAFPALWKRKLVGLGIGVPALLLVNFVRIVSLYYVGVHCSARTFEIVHVEVWQPLFILLAMVTWIAWALWATREHATTAGAEAT